MTIERKVGMGIAGQPTGPDQDVAEVFSTHLYTGNNGTQTITNGIDLAGEGGMVWIKSRNNAARHPYIHDTERGIDNMIQPNSTNDADDFSFLNLAVASNGFSMNVAEPAYNSSGNDYASWTFRKKEKFFDIVTWTGNDSTNRTISHNLGSVPAMMLVKMTNGNYNWNVYHSGIGATKFLELNTTNGSQTSIAVWNNTAPTDSVFTVGNEYGVNQGSKTYVAYLFADNSSEDAKDQMIKCGSYSSVSGNQEIDLGWEPQWLLVKKSDGTEDWAIIDNMRGFVHTANDVSTTKNKTLFANKDSVEESSGYAVLRPTATGFIARAGLDALYASAGSYIYMAIRAPMMKEPEAATDVFAIDRPSSSGTLTVESGFPIDFVMVKGTTASSANYTGTRLTGMVLYPHSQGAEWDVGYSFDFNDKATIAGSGNYSTWISWMWKRAKGYFDVVTYSGNATSGRAVPHSLGVAPEMMWVKARDSGGQSWRVYHASSGATHGLNLDGNNAAFALTRLWNDTAPTNSSFIVGNHGSTNDSSHIYIAYLFATLPGISKVGQVTIVANVDQDVDCGFSAGARFLLIKRFSDTGNWDLFDTTRGIVAGNDPRLQLNSQDAEYSGDDYIDPYSAGFSINGGLWNSGDYLFYAIA
jgi:hypothetical protein